MKRIAVLTSGGDAPGMNAAIRAVTRKALSLGMEVVGIRRGYAGLIEGDCLTLNHSAVGGILHRGGTVLQSARCKEFVTEEGQEKAVSTLREHRIEGLVVIGGNGSLTGAQRLAQRGIATMGLASTIDNDLYGVDMAIGVDTAANTAVEAINKLRDTATSHERTFIVETMGRDAGYLALISGIAGGAEAILIPEVPFDLDAVVQQVMRGYQRGKKHIFIVVAEGIARQLTQPAQSHCSAAHYVGDYISRHGGMEVRVTVLGHIQRGGSPTAFDRVLASRLGAEAVTRFCAGEAGLVLGLQRGEIASLPLHLATSRPRGIDRALLDLAIVLAQ